MVYKLDSSISTTGLINIIAANGLGWHGLSFYIISQDETLCPVSGCLLKQTPEHLKWEGNLTEHVKIHLEIKPSPTGQGVIVSPKIINEGATEFKFDGYGFKTGDLKLPKMRYGTPVYSHSENLRCERLPHCRAEFPLIRPIPLKETVFGTQSLSPISVMLWGETGGNIWLMEGSFTQDRHFQTWRVNMAQNNAGKVDSTTEFIWNGGHAEVISSGVGKILESVIYCVFESAPDSLYKPYIDELTMAYKFQGAKSKLDREPVFCTWNYNIFTNLSEADCLKRMDTVHEVQQKGFFQLDHGYQPQLSGAPAPLKVVGDKTNTPSTPELDVYFPDPENAWDLSRFPSGPRGFVDACKKRCLRPSIWWSPRVAKDGAIFKERRNWILEDKNGSPIDTIEHCCIDPSVPDAWDFLEYCVRTITEDWGFEGIKLDFYSWMFDFPGAVFRNGGTGVAWKRKFIKMIRSYLGDDGYFLHCISCPLGNPFLAIDGFDSFRAGIDIHSGEWEYHVRSVTWLLPAILSSGKDTWFANIDSCMGKPDIPEIERRSRLAFAYITGGMLEFSGPVELLDQRAKSDYKLIASRCDQGGVVLCPDEQAFYGRPLPDVLIREHSLGSFTFNKYDIRKTIALFNWADRQRAVSFSLQNIDFKNLRFYEFWSNREIKLQNNMISADLPPRGHLLIDCVNDENTFE